MGIFNWLLTGITGALAGIYVVVRNRQLNSELEEIGKRLERFNINLEQLMSMLEGIHEFGLATSKHWTLEPLYKSIVENACLLMRTDIGSIMILNNQSNLLEVRAAKGLEQEVVETTQVPVGEGIAGRVVVEGEPILCSDIETDPRFMRSSQARYTTKSFVSVPLKVKNRTIGVLNVNNKEAGQVFDERDLRFLMILADEAAITIENAQLHEQMRNVYLGTVRTLAGAIEAKDPYTRGHSERVSKYAVKIARRMKLPELLVRNIEAAATIHDIGKIGIRDDILLKPTRLTPEEMEQVKLHPLIGERIVRPIELLEGASSLILYSHERWDGKGYLRGLKAEEIPLGSRIIFVADSYDAMTSHRTYAPSLARRQAIEELKRNAGTQFDPDVVKIMVEILEEEEKEDLK